MGPAMDAGRGFILVFAIVFSFFLFTMHVLAADVSLYLHPNRRERESEEMLFPNQQVPPAWHTYPSSCIRTQSFLLLACLVVPFF